MTAKEFKKNYHFRNCADRNCFNCKHRWRSTDGTKRSQCWFEPDNPMAKFAISNFMVCDKWELNKNFIP